MSEWLKWYLQKFGSRDFIGLWLAWMGFVTLCVIEMKRAFADPTYQVSTVFTTILGGVIGYVIRSKSESDADNKPEGPDKK